MHYSGDQVMKTLKLPHRVWATHGTPLMEVFSVSIENKDDPTEEMRICGDITITDGEGVIFKLFSQEENKPETVTSGQFLPLEIPEYRAISPNGVVRVDVRLVEVKRRLPIFAVRFLDYRDKTDYDKHQTVKFMGSGGVSASMNYITYRCAVIGYPLVTRYREEGDCDTSAESTLVYGSIVVSRVNKLHHQCIETGTMKIESDGTKIESGATKTESGAAGIESGATTKGIVLFESLKDEPVTMEFEATYELFGALVVPAYSYIRIHAHVQDAITDRFIARGFIEFDSQTFGYSGMACGCLKVGIEFCHPYSQPRPLRKMKGRFETSLGSEKVDSEIKEKNKNPWVPVPYPQASSVVVSSKRTLQRKRNEQDLYTSVLEIFSVAVGPKIYKLFGDISVYDGFDDLIIYKREKHTPEELSQDNEVATIDIVGTHRVIDGNHYYVHLDLKDDQGRRVADGYFEWRFDERESWLGKRICSFITGECGYVAVHYSVFRSGLPATVKVSLLTSEPGEYIVYGTIVSEYGRYKCLTYYDKEFYRSRLFVKPETNPFKSCSKSSCLKAINLPLSKAVVAVPKRSSLDLHFDLHVVNPNGFVERVNNTASFKFSRSLVSVMYKGTMFSLGLDVKWGEVS